MHSTSLRLQVMEAGEPTTKGAYLSRAVSDTKVTN